MYINSFINKKHFNQFVLDLLENHNIEILENTQNIDNTNILVKKTDMKKILDILWNTAWMAIVKNKQNDDSILLVADWQNIIIHFDKISFLNFIGDFLAWKWFVKTKKHVIAKSQKELKQTLQENSNEDLHDLKLNNIIATFLDTLDVKYKYHFDSNKNISTFTTNKHYSNLEKKLDSYISFLSMSNSSSYSISTNKSWSTLIISANENIILVNSKN